MFDAQLVLASSSPYRRELLQRLRLPFHVASPDVDEEPLTDETPDALALRLAETKAKALARQFPQHLLIGSDQVAELDGALLGKPGTRAANVRQLLAASGKQVRFYTAVCVYASATGQYRSALDCCAVQFKTLPPDAVQRYVDAERPFDCAGGFKVESLGIALFERIQTDDPTALVGLPLLKLVGLLESFGLRVV